MLVNMCSGGHGKLWRELERKRDIIMAGKLKAAEGSVNCGGKMKQKTAQLLLPFVFSWPWPLLPF